MFREYYRTARIFKRRSILMNRPAWQDVIPDSKEGKDAYRIAAKHEGNFKSAFKKATRELLPEKMTPEIKEAWEKKSTTQLMAALPINDDANEVWKRFQEKLVGAYEGVIDESGKQATEDLNKKFKTRLGFTARFEQPGATIEKAAKKFVVTVPVNPYSIKWIDQHALDLAKNLSQTQTDVTRQIIEDGFAKGLRAEELYESIRANIGLTKRDIEAGRRKTEWLNREQYNPGDIVDIMEKWRNDKLDARSELIARTETISAQAKGREQAWQLAQDSGQLPEVERVWISAPESPNPNRPCEICLDLNGKTAKLGEPYESIEGPIDGPTAHPGCRCTETLRRVGKEG